MMFSRRLGELRLNAGAVAVRKRFEPLRAEAIFPAVQALHPARDGRGVVARGRMSLLRWNLAVPGTNCRGYRDWTLTRRTRAACRIRSNEPSITCFTTHHLRMLCVARRDVLTGASKQCSFTKAIGIAGLSACCRARMEHQTPHSDARSYGRQAARNSTLAEDRDGLERRR